MDLGEFQQLSSENDGVRYLLYAIDIFSLYIWVRPLKNKSSAEVIKAMKSIFDDGRKTTKLRTDQGKEFLNARMEGYTKEVVVQHFHTQNEVKANYAERAIRTLKNIIYRMINSTNSNRYIDQLPNLVHNYNHSAHRSLNDRTPASITKENEVAVWREMYLDKKTSKKRKKRKTEAGKFKFRVGNTVRISHTRRVFSKDSHHRWTIEIFNITHRSRYQNIPVYRLEDTMGEKVDGTFYTNELQSVSKNDQSVYKIEKVIKKIKLSKGRGYEYLVRRLGYPSKFDSRIPAHDMQALTGPDTVVGGTAESRRTAK
jgi:hypothetical protein